MNIDVVHRVGFFWILCIFVNAGFLCGQSFSIDIVADENHPVLEKYDGRTFTNTLERNRILNQMLDALVADNYLEASVDSISENDDSRQIQFYVHLGPEYRIDNLKLDSAGVKFLSDAGLDLPVDAHGFIKMRRNLLNYYARNGYPFAIVSMSRLDLYNGGINADLQVDKGPLIIFDSLSYSGNVRIRPEYLYHVLGLEKNMPYDHEKMTGVEGRINNLGFVRMDAPPRLSIYDRYVTMELFLMPKNASRFDVLFGIIPTNSLEDQSWFLSLDLTAEMVNKLGSGEYFYVDFERLRPEQQKFELKFNYPYILGSPFAADLEFQIFRNSFEYQTLSSDLGIRYLLGGRDYIKAAWNFESSRLIDIDTTAILAAESLPQDLDINLTGIAVEARIDRLDYRFNPRQGHALYLRLAGGRKTIKTNPGIFSLSNESVDFSNSYDTLDLVVPRVEIRADISRYQPLASRGSLMTRLQAGLRYSPNTLYRNEKFQIGGHKLLRGFDEASLFTTYYAVTTIAYRLLLSNNSYLSIPFIDTGVIENSDGQAEWIMGVGGGLGVETAAGLFNFSVAVGRTGTRGFDFSRPKAHIGFISLF